MAALAMDCPPTLEQVMALKDRLDAASRVGPEAVKGALPADVLCALLKAAFELLKEQPTLVELELTEPAAEVLVVGDTHGHFHDVLHMLDKFGYPSERRIYVFNGDYVDRGAWGVELFSFLIAMKLAMPGSIHLLRGNHESSMCTRFYGFLGEIQAKYTDRSKEVYQAYKKVFSQMPLACLIQKNTLVLHGGLFRPLPEPKRGAKRRKLSLSPKLPSKPGTLDDLRKATKGGMDPDGRGNSLVATDVLWSDPVAEPGIKPNDARGVGLIFGPDATQTFLEQNGLKLIIRSHEGPDARDKRSDLPQVLQGFSWDHTTPAGKLVTLFSAPDYPQFMEDGAERYKNLAAVAVLSAPDYATADMRTFEAVNPRPSATAYYDYNFYINSDDELPEGEEEEAADGAAAGTSPISGTGGASDAADPAAVHAPAPETDAAVADASMAEAVPPAEAATAATGSGGGAGSSEQGGAGSTGAAASTAEPEVPPVTAAAHADGCDAGEAGPSGMEVEAGPAVAEDSCGGDAIEGTAEGDAVAAAEAAAAVSASASEGDAQGGDTATATPGMEMRAAQAPGDVACGGMEGSSHSTGCGAVPPALPEGAGDSGINLIAVVGSEAPTPPLTEQAVN